MSGFAQTKEITPAEHFAAQSEALKKAESLDRRHIEKREAYRDNKPIWTDEWQFEYLVPDRSHQLYIRSSGGKTLRTEQ